MAFNRITRIVAPLARPVSVNEVRSHLAITQGDEYYINSLIDAATAMIDGPNGIGIALCPQTYRYSMDGLWPTFTLPVYPVQSVVSVSWIDSDDVAQTSTDFRLDADTNPARVWMKSTYHKRNAMAGTVKVTFIAGHDAVPADLKHAVLMLVGHLYENREASSTVKLETVPMAVETILARYRVV